MNKVELINIISSKTGVTKRDAENMIDTLIQTIINTLKKGEKVVLTGFGMFETIKTKSRIGVNPRNLSRKISIPSIILPKFRAGKRLKDEMRK